MEPSGPPSGRARAILSGFIIDLLDFVLRGSPGLYLGFPSGFVLGILLGRYIGLSWVRSVVLGGAAGIYCTIPGTFFLPLGTLSAMLAAGKLR